MKYVVLIGDGMADRPASSVINAEISGRRAAETPLHVAETPNMDFIASAGKMGLARTIPEGCPAGSDIAILSILGYDPRKYYTGRGPLEALGMGIPLQKNDIVFRCNLVTVQNGRIRDYSGGHISTEEAKVLISALNEGIKERLKERGIEIAKIKFYAGVSYRNVLVLGGFPRSAEIVRGGGAPPHEIVGERIEEHLPKAEVLREIVLASHEILDAHDLNAVRSQAGKKKANIVWLWSGGVAPKMPAFEQKYGVGGGVVSAVMLVKGIGRCIGLDVAEVEGATGFLDTNYEGKVQHALSILRRSDFVLLHVEAPDEASHLGDFELKVKAIEDFDKRVVGRMLDNLSAFDEDFRILLMPDHATPVSLRVHT
ncbi:MAG: cofactor-independent phosphoglycerate mutase, partial [Methanophagales archaeon]|nr:cofactor-independent phosphoglycerate mutase [Methanophagales archaeon]